MGTFYGVVMSLLARRRRDDAVVVDDDGVDVGVVVAAVAEGVSREAREATVDEDLTSAGRTGEGDLLAVERGGGVDEGAEEEAADVEGLGVDSRGGARAARRWLLLDEGRLLEREANEAERRVGLGLSAAAAAMAADGDGEGVGEAKEEPALELRRGGAGRVDGDKTGAFETALGALGVMDDDADDEEADDGSSEQRHSVAWWRP